MISLLYSKYSLRSTSRKSYSLFYGIPLRDGPEFPCLIIKASSHLLLKRILHHTNTITESSPNPAVQLPHLKLIVPSGSLDVDDTATADHSIGQRQCRHDLRALLIHDRIIRTLNVERPVGQMLSTLGATH